MGQISSTPELNGSLLEFVNLPKEAIKSIWLSYNLLGEGWGFNEDQFVSIFTEATFIKENYSFSTEQLKRLFDSFDTDRNGLVDALEILVVIALLSGMDAVEKLYFVYSAYDFDSRGFLRLDEVNLLLRSVVSGLSKASPTTEAFSLASLTEIEKFANLIYQYDSYYSYTGLKADVFKSYCLTHPIISNWLKVLSSLSQPSNVDLSPESKVKDVLLPILASANPFGKVKFAQQQPNLRILKESVESKTEVESDNSDIGPSWAQKVFKLKPEELPPIRNDIPQDLIEPFWIGGINSRLISSKHKENFARTNLHHSARYRTVANDTIVFPASNTLVVMKKQEETAQWTQQLYNEHENPISAISINYKKNILVTVDRHIDSIPQNNLLVVWDLSSFKVLNRIVLPTGGKFLDLNTTGNSALVVLDDIGNTLQIIDLFNGTLVFSKKVMLQSLGDEINDACFLNTSTMIAIATAKLGVKFLVDEEAGVMGPNMKLYEERDALYGIIGKNAKDIGALSLARLELPDELVCGTEKGQLVVFRGKTVSQIIDAHRGAVTALDYNPTTKTLISASEDGTVALFEIQDLANKGAGGNKGPKPMVSRILRQSASFDILHLNLQAYQITSVTLADDASKALVVTSSNELVEIACKIAPPNPDEVQEEAGDGEGGVPASKGKLGDDLHGGAIVSSHFLPVDQVNKNSPVITSSSKYGSNGFITTGSDGTIRLWQTIGEGEGITGFKLQKFIKMDCVCSAVAASSSSFVVALSGGSKAGSAHFFGLPDGNFINELSISDKSIYDIKFAPEGNVLVATDIEGCIHVFGQTEGAWSSKGKITDLTNKTSSPSRLDLSADNAYIRVFNRTTQEIRIYDIGATFGKELFAAYTEAAAVPRPISEGEESGAGPEAAILETIRGITWTSNYAPFNWDTRGSPLLHQLISTEGDYPFFDRSNHILLSNSPDGKINVSRVPTFVPGTTGNRSFVAHIGGITALSFFDEGGVKLLTTGALDGLLKVWKVTYDMDEIEVDLPEVPPEEGEEKAPANDEEEEGKITLPLVYDSGDEEDLFDGLQMKRHLKTYPKEYIPPQEKFPKVVSQYTDYFGYSTPDELSKFASRALGSQGESVPIDDLSIEWIYGCTARQTRQSVFYTPEDNIAYPAGGIAVMYNKVTNTQISVQPHRDEITALDIHLGRGLGVSVHKGSEDIIAFIWKTSDASVIKTLNLGEVNGVSAVKFSPDGSIVVLACQDPEHTILVYSTDNGVLLAKDHSGSQKILCLCFSDTAYPGSNLRFIAGAVKSYKVITYNSSLKTLTFKIGGYGADVRKSNVNCVVSLPMALSGEGELAVSGNEFLLGMSDGTIGVLARGEAKVSAFNPITKGPVTALAAAKIKLATPEEPPVYKVIVGCTNGYIKILDQELQPISEFNLYIQDYGLYSLGRARGFKSLTIDKLNRKILFATAAGEIGEIDLITGKDLNENHPVITAHFRDNLTALATHPLRQECLTVGEDKTLRIWNLESHKLASILELPGKAIAGAFAPNGHLIVASLGRKNTDTFGGRMAVVSYLQGSTRIVHVTNDAKEEIMSLVFSPDGSRVFAASLDCNIYVYDALNNFTLMTTLAGATEGIVSLDMSSNGKTLVSEGINGELLVWELHAMSPLQRPHDRFEVLSDIGAAWTTRQTVFGLSSIGVIPAYGSREDVISLTQSHNGKVIATGDAKGNINLFTYPVTQLCAPHKIYKIHTPGGVSKVSFSVNDTYFLSVGKADNVLVQWKFNHATASPNLAPAIDDSIPQSKYTPEDVFDNTFVVKGHDYRQDDKAPSAHKHLVAQLTNSIGVGHFSSPAPTESAIPVNVPAAFFCGHGEVLASFGKTVGVLEDDGKKVRLWNKPSLQSLDQGSEPTFDVSCIATSVSGKYVAVGYLGKNADDLAPLHLFEAPTGRLISVLSSGILGGVISVAFSKNGDMITCIGRNASHTLHVFKTYSGFWDDAFVLYEGDQSLASINLLSFAPGKSSFTFLTAGDGSLKFWSVKGLTICESVPESTEVLDISKTKFTAVDTNLIYGTDSIFLIGTSNGEIFYWMDNQLISLLDKVDSAILSIVSYYESNSNSGFFSTTKDSIDIWKNYSQPTKTKTISTINLHSSLYTTPSLASIGYPLSLSCDVYGKQLLVTLGNGVVVKVAVDSESVGTVFEGQSAVKRARQLIRHPKIPGLVLTVADDNQLRLWDVSYENVKGGLSLNKKAPITTSRSLCGYLTLEHTPTAATFLSSGDLLVAISNTDEASASAGILVIQLTKYSKTYNLNIVGRLHNIGKGAIHQLRLSPEEKYLAASSNDGCVYLYEILKDSSHTAGLEDVEVKGVAFFRPKGFLLAHPTNAPVLSTDFSTDNRYIRTFGENYAKFDGKIEMNYFDFEVNAGVAISSGTSIWKKQAAGKVQDIGSLETLKTVSWATASSAGAAEVRGLSTIEGRAPLHVESLSISDDQHLVVAGYNDGIIRIFRFPSYSKNTFATANAFLALEYHATGPVLVTFLGNIDKNLYQFVSYGLTDNLLYTWTVEV